MLGWISGAMIDDLKWQTSSWIMVTALSAHFFHSFVDSVNSKRMLSIFGWVGFGGYGGEVYFYFFEFEIQKRTRNRALGGQRIQKDSLHFAEFYLIFLGKLRFSHWFYENVNSLQLTAVNEKRDCLLLVETVQCHQNSQKRQKENSLSHFVHYIQQPTQQVETKPQNMH